MPCLRRLAALALAVTLGLGVFASARAQDAAALLARHENLRERLANSPFRRPLVLESTVASGDMKGDVYAVVETPFSVAAPALQGMGAWCDLLILHLNVKHCSSAGQPPNQTLSLVVGRKFDQPLSDGYLVAFAYSVPAASADYLRVQMAAENGPLSTHDYRLALEAVPLDSKSSFVHMSYSYAYGMGARLAMQAYLATIGHDKIGFSVTGKNASGAPVYADGVRGVLERNTMRYYLAIESYLGALAAPPAEQQEKRLRDWFDATERHRAQLHEIERDEYLTMKRHEVQRQRTGSATAPR
jgi:hypothetical protein